MPRDKFHKFFLSIVLPSLLAVGLFILSIFLIILPAFEANIMAKKKEMIGELTHTAWSLLEEYEQERIAGHYSLEEAQQIAASRIARIRYGSEGKDYFWIIDTLPTMVMHPYRTELKYTDLRSYADPNGKKLFVEAVRTVKTNHQGYIDYMWQWKDDSTRIVPKLSYVKKFDPWGWIIGTGIYLEDVRSEIRSLQNRLLRISMLILLVIVLILLFVIRQSLIIENSRREAEEELIKSRHKYKSLVEASTEGTLMITDDQIIFSNMKFSTLAGYTTAMLSKVSPRNLFTRPWDEITAMFESPGKSVNLETELVCSDNNRKEVVISVSKIDYSGKDGYIVVTKEIGAPRHFELERSRLASELQTVLLLMSQPIGSFIRPLVRCAIDASIREIAVKLTEKNSDIVFVAKEERIVGVITTGDLGERVVGQGTDPESPADQIMSSPVRSIAQDAFVYEALLVMKRFDLSHLAVKDETGLFKGYISKRDISHSQQNSIAYLIREIQTLTNISEICQIPRRLPALVDTLMECGAKTENITRIITSVSDAVTQQIIKLTIEELGPPPCRFAFVAMGSEGRKEQTLSTDQDNAIVIEDSENESETRDLTYFVRLGQQVCTNLDKAGYRFCPGNIMAMNPKWTQPLSVWKDYFAGWIAESEPQNILDASIFFDFRLVYGDEELIGDLRSCVTKLLTNKSVFFYHLAQNIVRYKPPLSLFGNIVGTSQPGDKLMLDLKKILLPVTGFIRLYSLFNAITETNSLERLRALHTAGHLTTEMFEELQLSYVFLMNLRFRTQTRAISQNRNPDNAIDIHMLTHIEIATFKKMLSELSSFQSKVSFDFKGSL